MPHFDEVPEQWAPTAPATAVAMDEWYFGLDGQVADKPVEGGRVEVVFYDADGAILKSVHAMFT